MDGANAPQLTEAEAEAALLVLGPRLEWKADGSRHAPQTTALHQNGTGWYQVQPDAEGSHYFAMHIALDLTVSYNPTMLTAETEAQAACERHHATGKWE